MEWEHFIREAPGYAALIVIVFGFLRYQEKRDARQENITKECAETIKENSRAMGEVCEVIRNCNGRTD